MKKADRIEHYVRSLGVDSGTWDPCYLAFFGCFNAQEYYEAHDVLEHLWLKGCDQNHAFYQGLIQLAGAFVHLKKQRLRPEHPTDGRRLAPATRLFKLALKNLAPYPDSHHGLDLREVRGLATSMIQLIETSEFRTNPWSEDSAPTLLLVEP